MEKLLLRTLVTFTVGFLLIGAVIGFVGVGDCGSVFSAGSGEGCANALGVQRALVIAFIGLGLTGLVASILADVPGETADAEPEAGESLDQGYDA